MSKVVKKVGRAVGKVVKGAAKLVKKVASSKFGKIALIAGLTFFGVPAVSGFLGGAAGAGASGLAGALNGISGAWAGLSSAASSALAGNFSQAGSQIASGFSGGGLVNQAMTPAGIESAVGTAGYGVSAAPAVASKGLVASAMSSPYTAPALIQAGGQVVSGYGQGKMIEAQNEREEKLAGEERERYNRNVGTRLFTT